MRKLRKFKTQSGFSLVEIMVGLVIGLLTTLAITQVVTTFEGQKRSTTGTSEAQVNGNIALYTIQKDLQMAGYGLPVFDKTGNPLKCLGDAGHPTDASYPRIDHDNEASTAEINLVPIQIEDGGDGISDIIRIRYGDTASAGAFNKLAGNIAGNEFKVDPTNMGCRNRDVFLTTSGGPSPTCNLARVEDNNLTDGTNITLKSSAGMVPGHQFACIGRWSEYVYQVTDNNLTRAGDIDPATQFPSTNPVVIVPEVVNIQAQYGISASATNNTISEWVNPTDAWENPSAVDRSRIKAVRIAIVTRNSELEKTEATQPCTTSDGTDNNGPCAWDDSSDQIDAAPRIDLSDDPNWQRYRYRVYETIIPLRNVVWARKALEL